MFVSILYVSTSSYALFSKMLGVFDIAYTVKNNALSSIAGVLQFAKIALIIPCISFAAFVVVFPVFL